MWQKAHVAVAIEGKVGGAWLKAVAVLLLQII